MGTTQSTHTTSEIKPSFPKEGPCSVSGRKIQEGDDDIVLVEEPTMISIDIDEDDDSSFVSSNADYVEESDDEADSNEEEDEEEKERLRIFEDAQQLKKLAGFFLQPEKPVVADATACARCFYSRYSAPEQTPADDEEEAALALADAKQLKSLAVDYLHPELSVKVDPACMGRNYFTRPSAEPQEDVEEAEERARILADAEQLKKLAVDYLHPEKPVVTSDPFACGRNYFTRPSAEYEEDSEECNRILEEMKELKKLAVDYMHPEKPVVTSDPCATGRNYFSRASAPEYEGEDDMEERTRILEEMKQLKQLAVDYLHPEIPVVTTDPCATGRNYFSRASAPEYEDEEDMDDRDEIMEDMKALKQLAKDYLEPERAVEVDPLASFRNYFERASGPEQESLEEAEERARILEDAEQLKKLAVDYLHPEKPVVTSDPFATGRNYFSRPSAPEFEDEDERAQILEEMEQLKQLAVDYMHPEKPVVTSDPSACGRNYFTRASADEYEDEDAMDDRDEIMEDMKALKQLAQDYLQPERPVEVDPLASCRNYFNRPSAESPEDLEEAEERARILADAEQLKKLAVDYLHPEKPVVTSDPFATGRNYFSRPSAPEFEDEDERAQILEEMEQLKQLAVDYMHPEKPVVTSDPCATGRNYFSRPSAPEFEDEEEQAQILADMKQLKQLAVDYLHPEKPVVTSDPCATGRNYFTRASAPEYDEVTEEERACILEEMKQMKKLATDYQHPEKPVKSSGWGRNYFDRPSAPGHADHIHTEGHSVEHGYTETHVEDHGYYHYHDYHQGHDGDSHSHVSDHFEMDEDMFQEFRESLQATEPFKGEHPKEVAEGEEEGKLSRSPSSVMLFEEAA